MTTLRASSSGAAREQLGLKQGDSAADGSRIRVMILSPSREVCDMDRCYIGRNSGHVGGSMTTHSGRIAPLAILFVLIATVAFAQFETAEVLGTVRDSSGAAIARATVTLLNQGTGIALKAVTDEGGNYDFFNVRVGRYTITAEEAGFTKFSTSDVVVNVNARQRVDITLQVG